MYVLPPQVQLCETTNVKAGAMVTPRIKRPNLRSLRDDPPPPRNKTHCGGTAVERGAAPRGIFRWKQFHAGPSGPVFPKSKAFPYAISSHKGVVIMTNDAKVGLVVGVGLVVLIAVVFYRQDLATQAGAAQAGAAVATTTRPVSGPGIGPRRATSATSTARTTGRRPGVNHTVAEGESLFSLAKDYYGDAEQYVQIYRANEKLLANPNAVAAGMVLFIPELPAPQPAKPE
jgi:hypothetical protein